MPVGPNVLKAFKSGGQPPMPQPKVPAAAKGPAAKPGGPAVPPGGAPPAPAAPGGGGKDASSVAKAAAEVSSGQLDPMVETMMSDFDGSMGAPPTAAEDVELWTHCVELVDPDGAGMEKFVDADPWLVVGQLYANLGGAIDTGEGAEPGGPDHAEPDADDGDPSVPA